MNDTGSIFTGFSDQDPHQSVSYFRRTIMIFKKIHSLIPFRRLFWLLLGIAVAVQVSVITYNHFSGFYVLDSLGHFGIRLAWGSLLSLIGSFLLAYPDLLAIYLLDQSWNWSSRPLVRIPVQIGITISIAWVASTIITTLSHSIGPYREGLLQILIYNGLIFSVLNIIMMMILEGWIFFIESARSKQRSEDLEQELSQIRFEVLKNQINPHFMFNSLNVLSSLIDKDRQTAQRFIDEFSSIYRYVLETIEQPVVTLDQELNFARSYMYLQQMRYGNHLHFSVDLPTHLLELLLPPLSLQVVLENACKHNRIDAAHPLFVNISHSDYQLVISNTIQRKQSGARSNGLGQQNLQKRYTLISDYAPQFRVSADRYTVTLPLIQEEF